MRYAFSPAEGPYDPEEADDHDTIADTRACSTLTTTRSRSARTTSRCGSAAPTDREVAGLSAVASPPEHRRQGTSAACSGSR